MSSPTHVRFPDALDQDLARYARNSSTPKSSVVITAVHEWLRMQEHPGIVFVTTVAGERRAALASGPEVWTIAEAWLQHEPEERSVETVGETLGLSPTDIENALTYWAAYRDEIEGIIERHRAAQDEALRVWEQRRELDTLKKA